MVTKAINLFCSAAPACSRDEVERAISAFRPISLEEMDGVRLLNRVDTKFAMRERQLLQLLAASADEYRVLEVDGQRCTSYSTLYFDSHSRDCYREHHNGRSHRCKYRMRSYGAAGPAFFEVKLKNNKGRTIKQRLPIPTIRRSIDGEVAAMAQAASGQPMELIPRIWTNFSRVTLVNCEYAERITLDIDLAFRDGADRSAALPGIAVVEVKQDRESRYSPIRRRLREFGVAPLRISKYCIGSVLLDPNLKYNQFKANLLALEALAR